MKPTQACLFVLAHVLLLCLLRGLRGEALSGLAALGVAASLIGLAASLDEASRRAP